jgi:hypothetical protein
MKKAVRTLMISDSVMYFDAMNDMASDHILCHRMQLFVMSIMVSDSIMLCSQTYMLNEFYTQ